MVDANIRVVFIGVETPNEEALRETKKLQNLRKGGTMLDKIHAVQQTGMEVWCGMILGFDSDDATIFDAQRVFIKDARIVNAMIGMLAAIPKTPLYARLAKEGRLDHDDPPAFGTNVIPLNLSRETLRDGYLSVLSDLHEPGAYFDRLDALYIDARIEPESTRLRHLRRHPLRLLALNATWALEAIGIFIRLMRRVKEADLRATYRRRLLKLLWYRRSPVILQIYAIKCAMHYHAHIMVQQMRTGGGIVNSF
jgi:radical SAM superfamily enzyme YgiQ (UPF0313 family)